VAEDIELGGVFEAGDCSPKKIPWPKHRKPCLGRNDDKGFGRKQGK